MPKKKIILASHSQRRFELLKMLGFDFEVKTQSINERAIEESLTASFFTSNSNRALGVLLTEKLSLEKAKAVWQTLSSSIRANFLVLAADTCVILNNKIYGKPKDHAEAKAMLTELSGNTHQVYTGVTIISNKDTTTFSNVADVTFCDLDEVQKNLINQYVLTDDPLDKAGAYGIQGPASVLIKEIKGDFFTIMGLPVQKVYREILKHNNL
ncbi:MAG: septum formation protein Maf [Clostridiaceae bacterium]|nr:septum formation protein Maf [Clostridiaceae bacterium]